VCGIENPTTANYCKHDGVALQSATTNFSLQKNKTVYCSGCGETVAESQNYCHTCGNTNLKFESRKVIDIAQSKESIAIQKPSFSSMFDLGMVKKAILPVVSALLILFLLSLSIISSTEIYYQELLGEDVTDMDINFLMEQIERETGTDLPEIDKLIGVTDLMLLSHLIDPTFKLDINGEMFGERGEMTGDIGVNNGIVMYLLIPFIALFIAGCIAGFRNKEASIGNRVQQAFLIAIFYSILLSVLSLFIGFNYKLNLDEADVVMNIHLSNNYSFFATLFVSFILAFLFSGLGLLFARNFKQTTGVLHQEYAFGEAIHQSIWTFVRGIGVFFVISIAIIGSKVNEFKAQILPEVIGTPLEEILDKSYLLVTTLSAQLSVLVWNVVHLSPLKLVVAEGVGAGEEEASMSYGLFSGLSAKGEANTDLFFAQMFLKEANIDLYLKLAIILPILLFLWAGYRIAAKSYNLLNSIAVFSILYAVLMTGLASLSSLGVDVSMNAFGDTEGFNAGLGFSAFGVFIRSLLFAAIFSYIGSWLHKWKSN
jgi:hypothetical protein